MDKEWGNKKQAAIILNCAPRSLKNYRDRDQLKKNIHWRYRNKTTIDYNLILIQNLMFNWLHPKKHEKFCQEYFKKNQ